MESNGEMVGNKTVFELEYVPEEMPEGHDYQVMEMASTITQQSTIDGSNTATAYSLLPIKWLRKVMEAARLQMVMQPLAKQEKLGKGESQLVIPYEKIQYADSGDWESSSEEYTSANTDMLFSALAPEEGVFFEPEDESYGIAITNKSLRTNAINQVESKSRLLRDRMSYVIDNAIYTAIRPASSGDVTEMSDSARGAQTIFGGDATTEDNTLDDGDTLTTAEIKKAIRLLKSKTGYYWTGNAHTKSSTSKNAWTLGNPTMPFYGIIKSESWESLMGETQFTNAAEFGSPSVVKSGQVAKYLGTNIAESELNASYDGDDDVYVQGATTALDTNVHEDWFVIANHFAGLVWGQQPKLYVFDFPSALQKRLAIEQSYKAKPIYNDAIVRVITTDD